MKIFPDFPQRWLNEYPPDVAELIRLHNGVVGRAEAAAQAGLGLFSKIRRGKAPYTELIHRRVLDALKQDPLAIKRREAMTPQITIHEKCPPLLADLIRHAGSKIQAMKALGTSDGIFYSVINGSKSMPPAWEPKILAALGRSVLEVPKATALPPEPEFVPWDGKEKITITLRPKPGVKKGRSIKLPKPLGQLIEKHSNIISAAAQSMGHTSGAFSAMIEDSSKFNEKWQRKVHRALHNLPPENAPSMGEDYDKYQTGFAIVMLSANAFDRIRDLVDILNGTVVFKRNTKAGWIIVYRMATEDLPKFKRLGLRDAHEIVCP